MSLSSSLFTGTSGLINMGNTMQVVGNNISNVNTVGFKKGSATFADTLSESVATQSGSAQLGRGMAIGSISQDFDQGSFESTGNTTDLSIGGDGFFVVSQPDTENLFYTRAGNFNFDKTGQLVNPEGYVVQGWELDGDTGEDQGSIRDIVLSAFTSPPKKTSQITAITNLDSDADSKAAVLSNLWDSSEDPNIAAGNYEYQTVVKAYDSLGSSNDITITYDKKSGTDWEYTVTCNPDEDNRNLVQDTNSKGLLARGTIKFSQSSGGIVDFTMDKLTGRIGNINVNGVNSEDATHFTIDNGDAMSLDGYGFKLEFDGSDWKFQDINGDGNVDSSDLPSNYSNASITYSDSQNIYIAMNNDDTEPDLKIKLDQPAVATDSVEFDVNNVNDLQVQGIEGASYSGDTANDNTSLEINDPSVMTTDSTGISMVWNPVDEKWLWSNPGVAKANGTLVSGMTYTGASTAPDGGSGATAGDGNWDYTNYGSADEITVNDASAMTMKSNIQLKYDSGGNWNWDMPVKKADFPTAATTSWSAPFDNPTLSGIDNTGATSNAFDAAGDYVLKYDPTATPPWDNDASATATATAITGDETGVTFTLANGTTARYSFGSDLTSTGTIAFTITPSAPEEYPNASLTTGGAGATTLDDILLDLNGDGAADPDLKFDMNSSGGVFASGETFAFTVDPDTPPAEYSNATLKGDQNSAIIDLDGSGNENDKKDVVFSFANPLKYGSSSDVYNDKSVISYDIKGSTAWESVSKDDISRTGYYNFTADFLGGENGSTEQDIQFDIGSKYDGVNFVNDSMSTSQYSTASTTTFQDGDGYAAGDLQGVDVASDGVMTGTYSNGQLIPLFRVGLAKFLNNQGLFSEGGNLFRQTRDSGNAITNKPGANGLGTISPNSLEMSNVDLSQEFVKMITTQRGFQANSKTITTVDDMMSTVIQMKR